MPNSWQNSLRRKVNFTHLKHIQTSNISPNTLLPSTRAQQSLNSRILKPLVYYIPCFLNAVVKASLPPSPVPQRHSRNRWPATRKAIRWLQIVRLSVWLIDWSENECITCIECMYCLVFYLVASRKQILLRMPSHASLIELSSSLSSLTQIYFIVEYMLYRKPPYEHEIFHQNWWRTSSERPGHQFHMMLFAWHLES